jgi:hypothetical protein
MFAFYPVLIDFGALAVTTVAFHLSATDRHRWAAVACVAASASREFGLAAALYGMHRAFRQRRFLDGVLLYVPSLVTLVLIRWQVMAATAERAGAGPPTLHAARENLHLWLSPAFGIGFAYFAVTLFGGISALLIVRGGWCVRQLWKEPELATFLLIVVAAGVAGHADIWRYLAFSLPAALVLVGRLLREDDAVFTRGALIAVTTITILTQHPFAPMDRVRYFVDWFPLYYYLGLRQPVPGLDAIWLGRLVSVALLVVALFVFVRRQPGGVVAAAGARR